MKLYHGSQYELEELKPQIPKGMNEFENTKGVFLCKTIQHAALYAIGKSLKGKTMFGVSKNRLVILGDSKLKPGYVYVVDAKNAIKGRDGQYVSKKKLVPIKKIKVYPKDYIKHIVRVKDKEEIIKVLYKN